MDAIDKVNIRLKTILKYVGFLEKYRGITAEVLEQNYEKRGAVERYFQLAIEAVIDIANLLNSEYRFRPAKDAKESILILGEKEVLPKEFAKEFSGVAGFRNILVHDYLDIDYKKVVDDLNNHLGDFEKFAKAVAKYLQ
ncbi:DUF86 domain-containing protein [Candidatus Shapirobacteria bacterium CG03_land_8_20_14_0_80_40_19]|uniref:DUF86 domain-containing protein n=4 Tax=Candidatus Shapironibacteriota TaxID=1752721 RepID=A0A2M7BCK7_9BACT|nr:MAG: hypothetical protein COV89_02990 [Candidatus Shapirobacteria bacterium CG11_big_fil_rev_8_21_14_0_20_40_12]PIV00837.1 MAG: DUF86 domain-containing protein [Candidatus Shapirobacteria bacterium CG03_land_8_20_14_0_80_40_19]PJC28777.1 MAG: DUF86 domain-containing protein [Candidatus Shapirobacteria bacterium CG_4_9_14_0_2_um_filter_40_11]PJC77032.1 MAG: DUF86 domain-containing protein [Candidatus Shapirobacteria bacterium CG_4_8_14_3_um_filter_39_11]